MNKLKLFLLLYYLTAAPAISKTIDIVLNFSINELPITWENIEREDLEFRFLNISLPGYLKEYYSEDTDKVIFMTNLKNSIKITDIPKEKLVLFLWEPKNPPHSYCSLFSRVYTFDDTLLHQEPYHKFFYPFLKIQAPKNISFEKRKLCTIATRHWTKERIKIVNSFLSLHKDFEFWGTNAGPFKKLPQYKGKIPGTHSGDRKIETLGNYQFCICFENSFIPGYITEKIFSCFAARSIPIYLGAPNIETYIPKECFIDYSLFESDEELFHYIKNMPPEEYQSYIDAIEVFLQSGKAFLFSPEYFERIIEEIIHLNSSKM